MYSKIINELKKENIINNNNKLKPHYQKKIENIQTLSEKIYNLTSFLNPSTKLHIRLSCIIQNITEIPKCKSCNKLLNPRNFFNKKIGVFPEYCNSACVSRSVKIRKKAKETNLKRYGTENVFASEYGKEKIKQTNLEKYGVEYPIQSEEIKEKSKITCLNRYGVEYIGQSKKFQKTVKSTNLERYGAEHNWANNSSVKHNCENTNLERYGSKNIFASEYGKKKIKQTNLEKYGVENFQQNHYQIGVIEKINDPLWLINQHHTQKKTLLKISQELGISNSGMANHFRKIKIDIKYYSSSQPERDITDFITTLYYNEIISNTRSIITPYELDIYLPDINLAFEYNGLFWHSEQQGKNKSYHLNKLNECNSKKIRLIQIFENEWLTKENIVKSRIRNLLNESERIYARKTNIIKLNSTQKQIFFNENHIQGDAISSINYGLIYNNELVASMTFGKSRYNNNIEYELIRYANKLNTSVVGGASKLFKHFIKIHNPKSIISYSDKRWNTGKLYEKLGFKFEKSSSPNYFYFKNGNNFYLESRLKFQKHKLSTILPIFNINLTEYQNMLNNGYDRIWDCGNDVFIWKY